MRVGIDGTTLCGVRAGVGRYVYELCLALDKELPEAEFFVYSPKAVDLPLVSNRWHFRIEKNLLFSKLRAIFWIKLRAYFLCKKDNLDVYWANGVFSPRLESSVKLVVTVHDLNIHLVPKSMKISTFLVHKFFFNKDICKADEIIPVSVGTSNKLREILGCYSDKIATPGVAPFFFRRSEAEVNDVVAKYKISNKYFLAVCTLEPRKNLDAVIDAYVDLVNLGELKNYQLILVGKSGWKNAKLEDKIRRAEKFGVRGLGYIPDGDLPALYTGCHAFIFASIYEGFGIPVAEARACGAQIIASNIEELREAGGDGPVYTYPDKMGVMSGIREILNNPIIGKGSLSQLPSWTLSAKVLANSFIEMGSK